MEQISNADKQARYRKKEKLKRQADQLLRKWQLEPWKHRLKSTQEIHHLIETAIKLPLNWTEEDYSNAEKKLYHVYSEIISPTNQLLNDIRESRNVTSESLCPSDLPKLNADLAKAEENTNALASHIISALKLSGCNEADQAAALMEAIRFVGKALSDNREAPCSKATTMCLATISPMYARPIWFAEKLANILTEQIHPDILHKIGKYLVK